MTFSEKLKAIRMQSGITQERLARVLGVAKRTIINYENGQTFPSVDMLPKIARLFNVTIESLVTDEEEFVVRAYSRGGIKGAREAEELVNEVSCLFAGGRLSDEDVDAMMRAIQNAYWIAKDESRRKYTPRKFREDQQLQQQQQQQE